jgi:formiminoglutamase
VSVPQTQPGAWPDIRVGSIAEAIRTTTLADADVALLGLPDDLGVRLNRGRPGAAAGPSAFREALARAGSPYDLAREKPLTLRICDVGDVVPAEEQASDEATLHATHDRVTEACAEIHRRGVVPVCIGGGHDLTFATVRALAQHASASVGGVNVDAHLDVREQVGSGMPFRSLIEEGFLEPSRFVEFGLVRFANSRAHLEWLSKVGGTAVERSEATTAAAASEAMQIAFGPLDASFGPGFISIDLDAIDASAAPGVSAPNVHGLTVDDALWWADRAGRRMEVRHFDIMELSPPHDTDARTARLAVLLFLTFAAAFESRIT